MNMITSFKPILEKYKLQLLLATIFALISVSSNLYSPIIIGDILDKVSFSKTMETILSEFLLLTFLYLIYAFTTWALMYLTSYIAFSSSYALRNFLYQKIQHLPISFYDTNAHGDIVSRFINDIDFISDGLLQSLATVITGIFMIIGSIYFMMSIHIIMALIVMVSAPVTFFIGKTIAKHSKQQFAKQAGMIGTLNGYMEEQLAGVKTMKAYHQEEQSYKTLQQNNQILYHIGIKAQFFGSMINPSTRLILNSIYAIVGFSGALFALQDQLTIGNISTFLIFSNLFSRPFNDISAVITQLQTASASMRRIHAILLIENESDTNINPSFICHGEFDFSHVNFYYQKNKPLIQDLNLHIPTASKVAIVGKTGAGKTTLVNLLMRFYDVRSGQIILDGVDIQTLNKNQLRSNFGMVLQDTFLFEDTVFHNLIYGNNDATKEEVIEACKITGAHSFIKRLEHGYDTILDGNTTSLSQGQQQLLSITRVFIKDPKILILDEATSSIDTRSEQLVQKAMQLLMENKTSFVIAHRLSTIVHSDMILVMDQGSIVEQGTHDHLLKKKGAYYQLYHAQFE